MSTAGLKRWLPGTRATVIGIPYLWLLLFFAVPFLIVLMISFSHSRVGSPPYTWPFRAIWLSSGASAGLAAPPYSRAGANKPDCSSKLPSNCPR